MPAEARFSRCQRARRLVAVLLFAGHKLGCEGGPMYYVYLLRSESHPKRTYVGSTGDLKKRLAERNAGKSIHTSKFMPWRIESYVAFDEKTRAEQFEKYLKSGSGRSFADRHFRISTH